jgi:hypothetical protein
MNIRPWLWLTVLFWVAVGIAFSPARTQSDSRDSQHLDITLELKMNGDWQPIDPGLVLDRGNLVRFRVRSDFEGYLYVMNLGTSGQYTLLFPREDTGRTNKIEASKEFLVPALDGSFQITGPPGYETVYWLVSPVELGEEAARSKATYVPLPPPPAKINKPSATLIPRCDDTMFQARGECIDSSAGPRGINDPKELPGNLSTVPDVTSRELAFIKKDKSTLVSAPENSKGPVIFEFRIAHR